MKKSLIPLLSLGLAVGCGGEMPTGTDGRRLTLRSRAAPVAPRRNSTQSLRSKLSLRLEG